jgi:hypothetical protein
MDRHFDTSDCAISLSWWGKAKSIPPECMSILEPSIALAITEHSMCHPGRPGPHGEGQEGSPTFDAFHKAKSAADRRPALLVRDPRCLEVSKFSH